MHTLDILLRERVVSGLKRKSITTCSAWTEKYRVMGQPFPGPWSFDHHPWTKDIHDCDYETVVCQKGAQLGLTETALNKTFYTVDIKGQSVLYVLPASTPDASDFSTSRFDPALELSTHLQDLFSDVKNIGHKRAGSANLYIRGSRSRSQLKSVPVSLVILDEVDEMVEENIPLVFERMSGQIEKQCFLLSTPTIDNFGINAYFRQSTQDYYHFICPSCGKYTMLQYPECLIITAEDHTDKRVEDSYLICKECNNKLPHETKPEWLSTGKWVSTYSDRIIKGYQISQLYSNTIKPKDLAVSVLKASQNPADEQELYNSKLGMTHIIEGARVTDVKIKECMAGFKKLLQVDYPAIITMGIDVGKWLHFEIDEWRFNLEADINDLNLLAECRLINEGKVLNFEELDKLMKDFRVGFCVIDANPERRKALEFAQRFWGRVKLCFYNPGIGGKQIHLYPENEHTLGVDRTSWMDLSLGRVNRGKIKLPVDLSIEYKNHLKAPVRVYSKDNTGNPVGKYVTSSHDEDHFAHARTYAEMALPLVASLVTSQDISGVF